MSSLVVHKEQVTFNYTVQTSIKRSTFLKGPAFNCKVLSLPETSLRSSVQLEKCKPFFFLL